MRHRNTGERRPRNDIGLEIQRPIASRAIYHEIRNRGVEHQRALLPLLLSDDTGVRSWAAAHALEFEPRQGEAVLLEIARGKGMDGFSARMTLKVWREGQT